MYLKAILLIGLARVLVVTENVPLCVGVYAVAVFATGMLFSLPMGTVALLTALAVVHATALFWALRKIDGGVLWWSVLVAGVLLGLL